MDDSITITLGEEDLLAALGEKLQEEYGTVDETDDDEDEMTLSEFDKKLVEINDKIDTLSCRNDPSITHYHPREERDRNRTVMFEFTGRPSKKDIETISDILGISTDDCTVQEVLGNEERYETNTSFTVFAYL